MREEGFDALVPALPLLTPDDTYVAFLHHGIDYYGYFMYGPKIATLRHMIGIAKCIKLQPNHFDADAHLTPISDLVI